MDLVEGAKVLANRLEQRHGGQMKVRVAGPVQAIGALPLFYWLGVEPPAAPAPGVESRDSGPRPSAD